MKVESGPMEGGGGVVVDWWFVWGKGGGCGFEVRWGTVEALLMQIWKLLVVAVVGGGLMEGKDDMIVDLFEVEMMVVMDLRLKLW